MPNLYENLTALRMADIDSTIEKDLLVEGGPWVEYQSLTAPGVFTGYAVREIWARGSRDMPNLAV